jgi:hypothetical protein
MGIKERALNWAKQPYFTDVDFLDIFEIDPNICRQIALNFEWCPNNRIHWNKLYKHGWFSEALDAPKFQSIGLRYEK